MSNKRYQVTVDYNTSAMGLPVQHTSVHEAETQDKARNMAFNQIMREVKDAHQLLDVVIVELSAEANPALAIVEKELKDLGEKLANLYDDAWQQCEVAIKRSDVIGNSSWLARAHVYREISELLGLMQERILKQIAELR